MPATIRRYRAACVQAEPGWFNLEKSVQKTVDLIREAGDKQCKLIGFPEAWIPGYPHWLWRVTYQDSLPLLKEYYKNSLRPDSDEMRRIRSAARDAQLYVSLGYSEVDGSSLYMAQVMVAPSGDVINHRRKIKPTHVERLVFGDGTGDSLDTVVETEIGALGHLNCWENMNPFLKALSCTANEQVHVAAWPVMAPAAALQSPSPYTMSSELQSELVTAAYAYETGAWTLAPSHVMTREGARLNLPPRLRDDEAAVDAEAAAVGNGFSRIYRPDGARAVADAPRAFEGLVVADIDLDETVLVKRLADFGGHYMRPDLLRLVVDKTPKTCVVDASGGGPGAAPPSTRCRLGLDKPLTEA